MSRQILHEEIRSERIAAGAQLFFVLAIFGVYYFSPKGFDASEHGLEPVRVWFSTYGPLLLLRLWLLSCCRVPNLVLYGFIAIDIAALSALIFSFHIQYGQPVTLSLRAPTFAYFFVFLAIRCLSYDPYKIIFAGGSAAACWIGILLFALKQPMIVVTSRFSEYLEPNAIIVGVEIDKILAVVTASLCLSLAVFRKRALLERFSLKSVREAAMERLIGKRSLDSFAPELSELKPGFWVRRKAATMMIDLRGFSKLTYQLPTEDLLRYLSEYQGTVARSIFSHGGSIDKYLGDGVLAHFGAVTEIDDYAKTALEAAEGIQAELSNWAAALDAIGVKVDFGIAVTIGEVVFGVTGHDERMEITVLGEAVNLSAKLEKHTKKAGHRVLTTKMTFETAKIQGFKPKAPVLGISSSRIEGIPHSIDLVGLTR